MVKTYLYDETQKEYSKKTKNTLNNILGIYNPKAYIKIYGCQQNVSDSEKYIGMLSEMGFNISDSYEDADLILFNTCAIRENAENKVFGNIGRLKHIKKTKPNTIIVLCGCMTQQPSIINKIKTTYPFIDVVFGTHSSNEFPKIIYNVINNKALKKNTPFYIESTEDFIFEAAPQKRDNKIKAFVSIMSGCNNYCSYCIVPYVRGRERSRTPEAITNEVEKLLKAGYKDITLLGQNVNSYGKDLDIDINFSILLKRLDSFDNYDYTLRFMTSHPKDATNELFDTIAESKHIARHIHLPVQCGSNRILKEMNRKYTKESYLEIIKYARNKIPNITFTSDIIVGFPGETHDEFLETVDLIKQVKFSSLFTFIYSKREGTPAAKLPDNISKEEKTKWLLELLAVQENISEEICKSMVGNRERVLCESYLQDEKCLMCRLSSNIIVKVNSEKDYSREFINIKITDYSRESLKGILI